jgi:CcmD family protein
LIWAFVGYGAILTLIFLYVAGLQRRQSALERELELLREAARERRGE